MTRPAGPLGSGERASIARLLEASRDALDDERIDYINRVRLAGYMVARLEGAADAVRQGHREHVLDRIVSELDQYREQLAQEGDGR